MHTDMTAVTVQSNKIVSNEVKDNLVLPEPSYGESWMDFLANLIFLDVNPLLDMWFAFGRLPFKLVDGAGAF